MLILIQFLPTHEKEHKTEDLSVLRHKCHNVPATCLIWKSHSTTESHKWRDTLSAPFPVALSKRLHQKKKDEKCRVLEMRKEIYFGMNFPL